MTITVISQSSWAIEYKYGLPSGLTFDEDTGIISGTPSEGTDKNVYAIEVVAYSNLGRTSYKNAIYVKGNDELYIKPALTLQAKVGEPFSYKLEYDSNKTYSNVKWGEDEDDFLKLKLPSGLTLNENTGVISGTPKYAHAGQWFTIKLKATTAESADITESAEQDFTIHISEADSGESTGKTGTKNGTGTKNETGPESTIPGTTSTDTRIVSLDKEAGTGGTSTNTSADNNVASGGSGSGGGCETGFGILGLMFIAISLGQKFTE